MTGIELVLEYLPATIRNKIDQARNEGQTSNLQVEEIRLRAGKPLMLKYCKHLKEYVKIQFIRIKGKYVMDI